MITDRLKEAINSATQLPPDQQDQIAAQIEEAVENAIWDAQLRDPQYQPIIAEMAKRALQKRRAQCQRPAISGLTMTARRA